MNSELQSCVMSIEGKILVRVINLLRGPLCNLEIWEKRGGPENRMKETSAAKKEEKQITPMLHAEKEREKRKKIYERKEKRTKEEEEEENIRSRERIRREGWKQQQTKKKKEKARRRFCRNQPHKTDATRRDGKTPLLRLFAFFLSFKAARKIFTAWKTKRVAANAEEGRGLMPARRPDSSPEPKDWKK